MEQTDYGMQMNVTPESVWDMIWNLANLDADLKRLKVVELSVGPFQAMEAHQAAKKINEAAQIFVLTSIDWSIKDWAWSIRSQNHQLLNKGC